MMAAAVERLLDDTALARQLGAQAKRTVTERFSLDRMVSATESLYDRLLTSKQRGAAA
jgi:glycosyltransferase involved in cell wall biosynthesis